MFLLSTGIFLIETGALDSYGEIVHKSKDTFLLWLGEFV